jgi:hypothetical protein
MGSIISEIAVIQKILQKCGCKSRINTKGTKDLFWIF